MDVKCVSPATAIAVPLTVTITGVGLDGIGMNLFLPQVQHGKASFGSVRP